MSNVIKQLGGGGAGPSIRDRIAVAKYTVSGEGLGRSVCKATTEQIAAPKKKHLDYLLQCTNEPNVSIPKLADLLVGRTQHHNWVTVYKGLITIHHLMNYGNERFLQYLASNNCTLSLPVFFDKNTTMGSSMSMFVRRYSKYVSDKAVTYRAMAFDFCKVKRGKEDGLLRTMAIERLLKTVPVLQTQIDSLVEFDAQPSDLHNGVINASFILLFKDLIRLFACYNDAMISLLEKYFELPRKQCREALDTYKRFLVRMDKVSQFLHVAEAIGIDKGEVPDLSRAPATLLEALETHLATLEGQPPASSALGAKLSPVATASSPTNAKPSSSDDEMRRVLEEEARRMEAFEKSRAKTASTIAPTLTPVSTASAEFTFDLFDAPPKPVQQQNQNVSVDQLFSFDLPTQPSPVVNVGQNPFLVVAGAQPVLPASNPFLFTSNPVAASGGWLGASAPFASGSKPVDFDAAFGSAPITSGTPFGGNLLLQPQPSTAPTNAPLTVAAKPVASPPVAMATAQSSLLTGDIDSSIASLAGNLSVSGGYGKQNWSAAAAAASQQKQPIGASNVNPYSSQPGNASNSNPFGPSWSANSNNILQPQPVASARPNSTAVLQNQLPQLYAFIGTHSAFVLLLTTALCLTCARIANPHQIS